MLRIDLSTLDDEFTGKLCSASTMVTFTQQEAIRRQIASKPAVYGL
jgi:hypothetical protein